METLLPELVEEILLLLPPQQLVPSHNVSVGLQRLVAITESRPVYWIRHFITQVQESGVSPEFQAFWLSVAHNPPALSVNDWKELYYHHSGYTVGKLLPPDLVLEYTELFTTTEIDSEMVKGIIYSDRAQLLTDWLQKYCPPLTRVNIGTLFRLILSSGGAWNLMVANVRDRVSNSRTKKYELEAMVLYAAQSPDIAHYIFVAQATGITRAIDNLLQTVIVYSASNLNYYLHHTRGAKKQFKQELARIRNDYWSYHEDLVASPDLNKSYLRFLRVFLDYSSPEELRKLISESPLRVGLWIPREFVSFVTLLGETPAVDKHYLWRTIVKKIALQYKSNHLEELTHIAAEMGVDLSVYISASILISARPRDGVMILAYLRSKKVPNSVWKYWVMGLQLAFQLPSNIRQSQSTEDFSPEERLAITENLLIKVLSRSSPEVHAYLSYKLLDTPKPSAEDIAKAKAAIQAGYTYPYDS
jgi:hypothetical protein